MSTATKTEIDDLFGAMTDAWNRHDTNAYAALWKEEADFVNVLGMHRGNRAELLAELDFLHSDRFKATTVDFTRRKVRFLTPDVAVVVAWWSMDGDSGIPDSPTADGRRDGVFTHVIQRTPEGWRIAASQNTNKAPIPDPLRPNRAALCHLATRPAFEPCLVRHVQPPR